MTRRATLLESVVDFSSFMSNRRMPYLLFRRIWEEAPRHGSMLNDPNRLDLFHHNALDNRGNRGRYLGRCTKIDISEA